MRVWKAGCIMNLIPDSLDLGVMEYWSVEKEDINPAAITPILQHYEVN